MRLVVGNFPVGKQKNRELIYAKNNTTCWYVSIRYELNVDMDGYNDPHI